MPRAWMLLGYSLAALVAAAPTGGSAQEHKSPGAEIRDGGRKVGHAARDGGKALHHGAKKTGKTIGKSAKQAGKDIAKGAKEIGHGVRDAVNGK